MKTALIAAIAALSLQHTGADEQCSIPYRNVLLRDGFTGLTQCSEAAIQAKEVGQIRVGGRNYSIINYRYRTKPASGGVAHGGQRIIVIEDGRKYVGQYVVTNPPFHILSIHGASAFLDVPSKNGNEIKFDPAPPDHAFLAGENVPLSK